MKTSDIKKALKRKKKKERLTAKDFVSTGSTLLNLACTGKPYCGFAKGKYYFIVGDSASGKTFLTLTCLAEASINDHFKDYRFIYDNAEDGALMDIKKFFGKEVYKRMEAPERAFAQSGPEAPIYSTTIEEFYYHVDDAIKRGKPFIYILDSMDSLSSEQEQDKFDETKKAHRKGRETTGIMTDGKAKKNATNLRRLITPLRKSKSILIILNQTRDRIGFGFKKKTRSGGHALTFYAALEIWSSVKGKIKKGIRGKKRQLGIQCLLQIEKNRITGKERKVVILIYHSFGIDDIGSCVNYLLEEGSWKLKGNKIAAPQFDFKGTKEKLIKYIETEGMEKDLRELVGDVWNEIEEACNVKRKRRYE